MSYPLMAAMSSHSFIAVVSCTFFLTPGLPYSSESSSFSRPDVPCFKSLMLPMLRAAMRPNGFSRQSSDCAVMIVLPFREFR